jgi:hypothetical protein
MEASEEIGDTFKELAKCVITSTDANSCLMWIDVIQRLRGGKGDTYRDENINAD